MKGGAGTGWIMRVREGKWTSPYPFHALLPSLHSHSLSSSPSLHAGEFRLAEAVRQAPAVSLPQPQPALSTASPLTNHAFLSLHSGGCGSRFRMRDCTTPKGIDASSTPKGRVYGRPFSAFFKGDEERGRALHFPILPHPFYMFLDRQPYHYSLFCSLLSNFFPFPTLSCSHFFPLVWKFPQTTPARLLVSQGFELLPACLLCSRE